MRVMSTWEGLLVRSRFSGKGEDAARRFCFCSIFRTRSASKSFNHRGHRGPLAEGQNLHHEGHEGTTTKGTKGICIRFRLRTPHELALPTAQITCEAGRPRPASALHCKGHRGPLAEGQKLHHEGHEGTTTKGTKEICIRFRLRTLHKLALPTAQITCEAGRPRPASALHCRGHRGPLAESQKLHHEGHEGTTTKGTKEICIRFRLRTLHELALPTAKITCEAGRPRPASALYCRGHRGPLAEGQKLHHEGHEGTTTKGTKEICIRFRLRTLHELVLPTAKITCEAGRPRPAEN